MHLNCGSPYKQLNDKASNQHRNSLRTPYHLDLLYTLCYWLYNINLYGNFCEGDLVTMLAKLFTVTNMFGCMIGEIVKVYIFSRSFLEARTEDYNFGTLTPRKSYMISKDGTRAFLVASLHQHWMWLQWAVLMERSMFIMFAMMKRLLHFLILCVVLWLLYLSAQVGTCLLMLLSVCKCCSCFVWH